jgi:cob(I)alamin adenosyltransferase
MKIYTKTGDDGTTSLSGGRRVPKHHIRIEAYGSVDELIAWIGLLRGYDVNKKREKILLYIQDKLMTSAAVLAYDSQKPSAPRITVTPECIQVLEDEIDKMEEQLPPLRSFILPGGDPAASGCHIARCVCRRAEREVLRLNEAEKVPETVTKFLNRLSDYLFVLGRLVSLESDNEEIKWVHKD